MGKTVKKVLPSSKNVKKSVGVLADPGNLAGKRDGGVSWSGVLDPTGEASAAYFGSTPLSQIDSKGWEAGLNKAVDPGNFFGKDETKAGYSMAGMLDPGGEIAQAAGSKGQRQAASAGGYLDTPQMTGDLPEEVEVPEIPSMADVEAQQAEEERKRDAAKRGRASTILTSSAGGGLGKGNIGAATLGGR